MAEQQTASQTVEQQATQDEFNVPPKKNFFTVLRDWPLQRQLALGGVLLVSIALFAFLIIQARTASQQLLYANLSATDAASVTEWLKGQKIAYTLKNGGKSIWIPSDQIYQSRLDLAANGIPSGGGVGFEIFDKQSFALTDYVQKVNFTRALQGELARTITSLAPVESTRVHLAIPEKRLFKDQQKNATASVIVDLAAGRGLEPGQVQGIINLVAGSVTGLKPKNIKVIDSNGVVQEGYKRSEGNRMLSTDMLSFQRDIESQMQMRAQDLLEKTMGKDRALVRVSASIDFSKIEKTEELYDGNDPVIRSEQVNSETASTASAGGIPGVESNLQGNAGEGAGGSPSSSKNSRTTNYEISKTISHTINPVGSITGLSVSVLVADRVELDKETNELTTTPRSEEELESIKNMVATAIGIVASRGDKINVQSMPFIDSPKEGSTATDSTVGMLTNIMPLLKYGLIFLGIFLTYFIFLRPVMKTVKGEVEKHNKTVEEMELERFKAMQEDPKKPPPPVDVAISNIRKEVMRESEPTAFIVKNWIQEG